MYQGSWPGGAGPKLGHVGDGKGAWQVYGGQAEGLVWEGSVGQREEVGLGGDFNKDRVWGSEAARNNGSTLNGSQVRIRISLSGASRVWTR